MPDTSAPTAGHYVDHLPLEEIVPAVRNAKAHAGADIARSISRFGVAELPLLDDRTGRLVAGHGRLEQLIEMHRAGQTPPAGVQVAEDGRWLMPVLRGWASRSDDEAEAYVVTSNHLTEMGGWDPAGLAEVLTDLHNAQLLELTGYTETELDDLAAAVQETTAQFDHLDDDDEDDEDEDPPRATRTDGLDDRRDDYGQPDQRVLVLSYPGDVYVWAVNKLSHLMTEHDVESNSAAVLKLIEAAVGETAPLGPDAGDAYLDEEGAQDPRRA